MPVLLTEPYLQFFDDDGNPLSGGKVYTYAAGTTTPKASYTDSTGNIPSTNPVILDAAGRATIWIQGAYKIVVESADGSFTKTTDNITSFNTIEAAGASYSQTWSGDNTTTFFATSQPLGTDENAVLVFVDSGLQNYITNGDFSSDTIWTKGTGWTIGSGVATATGAISTALSQTATSTLNPGQSYTISFTVTASAGTLTPSIGGASGTTRGTGTFTETIIAGATQLIALTGVGFTGTVDNVSVRPVEGLGWQFVPPSQYTLTNSGITFASAPKQGTNNIFLTAPSTLVAAASASAAAAEAFANAAGVSATNAQLYAQGLTSTSSTSLTIGNGSKAFTTQIGKQYTAGQFISAVSAANNANYMHGNVVSYIGTTLTLNITDTGGSGTFADWNLSISGTRGATAGASTPIAGNSFLANKSAGAAVPGALTISSSKLVGRGTAGNIGEIDIGTGLTLTGNTLSGNTVAPFTSPNQSISASGFLTIPHGLGTIPSFVVPFYYCVSSQNGWTIGDSFMFFQDVSAGSTMAIYYDATNVYVRYGNGMASPTIINKSSGASTAGSAANWNTFFKVYP